MYWFFNCNNYHGQAIKALVYSAFKHNPHFIPICLWDEPNYPDPGLKMWLDTHGVIIVKHKAVLDLSPNYPDIKEYADTLGWGINILTINGCWQKVDVPKICYDLGINDRYVLLTDPDCLWLDRFELEEKPDILAAACEEEPFHKYISGGIYVWNVPKSMNDYNGFLFFCMQNFKSIGHGDNVAYLQYYGYEKITHLSPDWNYKPYWKKLTNGLLLSPKEKIQFSAIPKLLHFQGASKPWMDFPEYYKQWYDEDIVGQMKKFNEIWAQYLAEAITTDFKFENTKTEVEKFSRDEIINIPTRNTAQLAPIIF